MNPRLIKRGAFSLPGDTLSSTLRIVERESIPARFCVKFQKFTITCFASQGSAERFIKSVSKFALLKNIASPVLVVISEVKFKPNTSEKRVELSLLLPAFEKLEVVNKIVGRAKNRLKKNKSIDKQKLDLSEFSRSDLLFSAKFVDHTSDLLISHPKDFFVDEIKSFRETANEIRSIL